MKIIKELKYIGNFTNMESAEQTKNFNVLYNLDTKKYYKVYDKTWFLRKTITSTNTETSGVVYDILLPFFKKKTTFLPELHYETKDHLFFEYYKDYVPAKSSDFLNLSLSRLNEILGITYKENNFKPTIFFNEVVNSFEKLYLDEKIYDPIPEYIEKIYASILNFKTNSNKLNYLTITPSDISLGNFVVKRDINNNILDWKFVNIADFTVKPPRYIFNLNDNGYYPYNYNRIFKHSEEYKIGGDDYINFKEIRNMSKDGDIVYCFNKKWYVYKYN